MTELAQDNVTERTLDTVITALSHHASFSTVSTFYIDNSGSIKQCQSHTPTSLFACVCVVSEVNMVIPLQRSIKQNNISILWVVLTASTTGPSLFLLSDILFSPSCTLVLGVHH